MISAILFDLDGTLLDLDLEQFLREYFALLGPVVGEMTGTPSAEAIRAVFRGTDAMMAEHPGLTNEEVFRTSFLQSTGVDLFEAQPAASLESFYTEVFPTLRGDKGPRPGAVESLEAAREAGLKIVMATNPIFPRSAVDERARWAGVETVRFTHVTSYENSTSCKPYESYFTEIAEQIGVACNECVMIGDDPRLDLAAASAGMRTFYVGPGAAPGADHAGDMRDVAAFIGSLHR